MTSPRSHSQSWPSRVWNPGPQPPALCRPFLLALFRVGRMEALFVPFLHLSPLPPRPASIPRPHAAQHLAPGLALAPSARWLPILPALLNPPTTQQDQVEKGPRSPLPAPPGGTHRGQGAARGCRRHCCQRPGQEPPHAWKSVQRHRPSSPEVHLSGELGRDWPAHQEHQIRLFPQPLGVLLKQDLTSGVRTNPAFSSEKKLFLPLSPFFLSSLCPHLQPRLGRPPWLPRS